ncbi:MAG: NAD(P)/FAD-dependent oxidoreductase [Gammaproteobacteria bacterium]|nr:NAD(P)/FAD-dependent oxidoreductase [Gammaproteobacteria bacterium]
MRSASALKQLFAVEAYWRDVVALDWTLRTVVGGSEISTALLTAATRSGMENLQPDIKATAPRWVTRAGSETLEAFVSFETLVGCGRGVLRLIRSDSDNGPAVVAWTLLTALHELKDHPETIDANRPTGQVHSRDFRGPNWLDQRHAAAQFSERDPAVLVVGAGQAGLSIAARLTQLGLDTLVLEQNDRVGDNWRKRYHALTLHNQVYANHLPLMPFPPNWPVYIPKDKLANWLEYYAEAMELNVWTSSELMESRYLENEGCWSASVRTSDGQTRILKPRHIVMATSVSGIPKIPEIPGLDQYGGEVIHASAYRDGEDHQGKSALVLGVGTSGHDIAQDLASSGATVTMVQRGSTMIINIEPGAQLPYALYHEGPGLDECDLITTAMPFPLMRKAHIAFTATAREQDWPLLQKLQHRGMKLDYGPDGAGWQFKYLTRGGGYYFNVGASEMIADGSIGLVQYENIERFNAHGVELLDGDRIDADLIVLATGYQGMSAMVERVFGPSVADTVGPIWGFDENELELRNMYCRTPQQGLWFIAGSFAQCRINSKYLALQIKASELKLH